MQLILLLLLAGLGLAQQPTKLKISGAPSQSSNLTNWAWGDTLPNQDKMQVAGSRLPVTQTTEVKPVTLLVPPREVARLTPSGAVIVGATTFEAAPYVIFVDPATKTMTIRASDGTINGGKILAVCNPNSCKEPQ